MRGYHILSKKYTPRRKSKNCLFEKQIYKQWRKLTTRNPFPDERFYRSQGLLCDSQLRFPRHNIKLDEFYENLSKRYTNQIHLYDTQTVASEDDINHPDQLTLFQDRFNQPSLFDIVICHEPISYSDLEKIEREFELQRRKDEYIEQVRRHKSKSKTKEKGWEKVLYNQYYSEVADYIIMHRKEPISAFVVSVLKNYKMFSKTTRKELKSILRKIFYDSVIPRICKMEKLNPEEVCNYCIRELQQDNRINKREE